MDIQQISRTLIEEAWNKNNPDVFYDHLERDFVAYDSMVGEQHGAESQVNFVKGMKSAFPDVTAEINDQQVDGDMVITRVLFTGTNTGSLMTPDGVRPPTNRPASVPVTIVDTYRNGKVVMSEAEWDPAAMMAQLYS